MKQSEKIPSSGLSAHAVEELFVAIMLKILNMCLRCYARMLGEHGHEHEGENRLRWARGTGSEQ
jgi:hypothetical protein